MTEPTELMPCPFCGHAGPLDFQDGSTHRWGVAYCAECGASAGETRREYPDVGGWHAKAIAQWNTRTPQPTQAQAGAVPLTDGQAKEVLWTEHLRWMQAAGLDTEGMRPTGEWLDHWLTYVRAIERAHGIGIKGGRDGNV